MPLEELGVIHGGDARTIDLGDENLTLLRWLEHVAAANAASWGRAISGNLSEV